MIAARPEFWSGALRSPFWVMYGTAARADHGSMTRNATKEPTVNTAAPKRVKMSFTEAELRELAEALRAEAEHCGLYDEAANNPLEDRLYRAVSILREAQRRAA